MNTFSMAMRVSTSGNGKRSAPAIKVAIAAVALSVAVMLAAIAIVLGFKEEITRKVIGFNPHIVLRANPEMSNNEYLVSLTPELAKVLEQQPFIKSYALSASVPAIFKTDSDFKGIYLKSLARDLSADFLKSQLVAGAMPDFANKNDQILISQIAADQLNITAGDTLPTYFITDNVKVKKLKVTGVYNSHFSTYDDIFSFGSLTPIQEIGDIKENEGTYVNIYVDDFNKINEYTATLRQQLDQAYTSGLIYRYYDIDTALTSGANFFSWLSLLDTNTYVILALMTAVALVTLISGMLILILDKKRFIAIMKALGASNRQIRHIFIWITLRVAFVGLIIGNLMMLTALFLQEKYKLVPLEADSYYIDFVPVSLTWQSILLLNASILVISFVMLLLPSRVAGSIKLNLSE